MPFKIIFLSLVAILFNACSTNIKSEALPVGVLDESYSYTFDLENGGLWSNGDLLTSLVDGQLPSGVVISANGQLTGIPNEVGNFEFKVRVYELTRSYDEDDISSDSEWFTLFVTENSTNANCPEVNSTTGGLYICGGALNLTNVLAADTFDLDINFFISYADPEGIKPKSLTFLVEFDSTLFALDDQALNATILREAATRKDGTTATFNTNTAGQLLVTITAENSFEAPGRFMNLPFRAQTDIPVGDYEFAITLQTVTDSNGSSISSDQIFDVNGSLTVE